MYHQALRTGLSVLCIVAAHLAATAPDAQAAHTRLWVDFMDQYSRGATGNTCGHVHGDTGIQ